MSSLPINARKNLLDMPYIEIFSMVSVPKGVFVSARAGEDFWIMLSRHVGWGRFSMIRPETEFVRDGGLFELVEVRSPDATPPESAIVMLNVLWRAQEGHEAWLQTQTSSHQEFAQELKRLQEPE